ncbi:MAG: PTS transporter subunit EIIC [Selenomonadaceae bacterium]|nr:PTS transporter subunit EIIC [Selenomonadaceae bacterium]
MTIKKTDKTEELAKIILNTVGGTGNVLYSNVIQATNCMTRLRLRLIEKNEYMIEALKKIDGVLGVNDDGDEVQVILGVGRATTVTSAVNKILEATNTVKVGEVKVGDAKALHDKIRAKNATPIKLFFKKIASIFTPLIPGFIACGLITGIVSCAIKISPELADEEYIKLLMVAGNAVFWGMNLFVGINAAKIFGGTPIIGGVLAALMTHPGLADINIFGSPFVPGRGGVISVIIVAAFASWLEGKLHKLIPEMFDLFLTPLVTVLIAGATAIFILQPVGGALSDAIGATATIAIQSGGAVVGFILAGVWLPLVMLGIHQTMTPIHVDLIAQFGVTILLPILAMAGAGQVGASIAVYFKTKNKFLKKTIASALPVGMMGVGEPLIYGVTFPLFKPFIGACIGGAFGGAIQATFMVGAATLGISGLPLAATTNNIPIYFLGLVTSYIVGFIATWILGFDDPPEI